ncbi:MAG: hypothetical protein ACI4VK_00865 [Candidatus Coproplasma sp.]
MKDNENEELYIPQQRLLSFLCATALLCIGLVFIAVPILSFLIPINASDEEIIYFRVFAFIFAFILGCPLIVSSISLFTNVGHKYAIYTNEKGIFINTDALKKGFISWTAIEQLHFNKKHMTGRYGRTLEVILNTDDKEKVRINPIWRLQSQLLRTKVGQRLLISFSFCKGRADENAQSIINSWEHYIKGVNLSENNQTD